MATRTKPPPTTPTPTQSQGSNDDQQVHERKTDPEGSRPYRQRPVSAPSEHSDIGHSDAEDTRASQTVQVPCPRQGEGRDRASVTERVSVTLKRGPDDTPWVIIDGVDIQDVAATVSAVCDLLNSTRPPR